MIDLQKVRERVEKHASGFTLSEKSYKTHTKKIRRRKERDQEIVHRTSEGYPKVQNPIPAAAPAKRRSVV